MPGRHIKRAVRDLVFNARSLSQSAETPREALLSLAELRRRATEPPSGASLTGSELRVFSQNGEDGVINELLRRSGIGGGGFVEFGAGTGAQNNCALLADVYMWSGVFIEADTSSFGRLQRKYAPRDDVRTVQALVTPENIESLLATAGVGDEFDVLSIDVDGADYWIWEAIRRFRPRIVVIEFNSALPAGRRLVQPRDRVDRWDRTSYFGASIDALEALAVHKGYRLVHIELTGTNAFFVRTDLPGEYLATSELARRGPNQFLVSGGHPPDPKGRPFTDLDNQS